MKPQLGDTVLNRYTLVSALRDEPGIMAWKANDRVLARDCQLLIITNREAMEAISSILGTMTAQHPKRFVQVLKFRMDHDVLIVIMQLDNGLSLRNYFAGAAGNILSYDAMRSILGECIDANPFNMVLDTDTVRVTNEGVQIACAPLAPLMMDNNDRVAIERVAVRQLATLLYRMLTHNADEPFDLSHLPADTPGEFRVICIRGLALDNTVSPMATLSELAALLGEWKPLNTLTNTDIALPGVDGECSIVKATIRSIAEEQCTAIPDSLISNEQISDITIDHNMPGASDGTDAARGNTLLQSNLIKPMVDTWNAENLSGEADTNSWYGLLHNGNPFETTSDTPGEETTRIPLVSDYKPTSEAQQALAHEIAKSETIVPPSFTPTPASQDDALSDSDNDMANENLLGRIPTKVVAIVAGILVVIAAAVWALNAFQTSTGAIDPTVNTDSRSAWPDVDVDDVPFGSSNNATTQNDASDDDKAKDSDDSKETKANKTSGDTQKTDTQKTDTKKNDTKKSTSTTRNKDKNAQATPDPEPVNTTPYTITSASFLTNPNGQSGYAYALHLNQPQKLSRVNITIRTSGGKGYIRANTTGDPTQGEQVAEFTFAEGGTTEVKLTKKVTAQDLILWVPIDSLPQNQLYIEKIEVL